jgi:hypothetical protein
MRKIRIAEIWLRFEKVKGWNFGATPACSVKMEGHQVTT